MKNQYFGDINDYRKYGLLRALQSNGYGSLLVAWMLTRDDGGRDGRSRSYLEAPDTWAKYDQDLFTGLAGLLRSASQPSVSLIERTRLLPRASYHSSVVPDGRRDRDVWRTDLLRAASGADLVFLDPDNGIEVPSKPVGRKGSSKYVAWKEIEALWEAGCSLLIYQHFRREARDAFARRLVSELSHRTGAGFVEAFRTPHVLFLLAAQDRHARRYANIGRLLSDRWNSQIASMGLAKKLLQPPAERQAVRAKGAIEAVDYMAGVFFISPIGDPESAARRRSDVIARTICEPLASLTGSPCVRADQIIESGLIIKQVLGYLLFSAFVVADVADGNPNVMYELAVRHVTGKPCFCLGRPDEKVPYDIAPLRVFRVDDADETSLEQTAQALIAMGKQIGETGVGPQSPLSEPLGTWRLRADPLAFSVTDFDAVFQQYGALRVFVANATESLRAGTIPHGFADDLLRQAVYMEGGLEQLRQKSALPSLESYIRVARVTGKS